jgi:hypothetical protein
MKAKRIDTSRWTGRAVDVAGRSVTVFKAPDGVEYARAQNGEHPDLILKAKGGDQPNMELVFWEGSSAMREREREIELAKATGRKRKGLQKGRHLVEV